MPHPDSEMNAIPAQPTGDGHHGHDPNQPRVPAGHSDGGQWTRTPGSGTPAAPRRTAVVDRSGEEAWGSYVDTYRSDGTLAEERVFNRDGSRIVSEFNAPGGPGGWDERHTVVLRDGSKVIFQNSGDVQFILDGEGRPISASVWTKDGPEQLPVGQLAYAGPLIAGGGALAEWLAPAGVSAAALALYAWFASRSDRRRSPVFAFKAGDYSRVETKDEPPQVTFVGLLRRDEVKGLADLIQQGSARQYDPRDRPVMDGFDDTRTDDYLFLQQLLAAAAARSGDDVAAGRFLSDYLEGLSSAQQECEQDSDEFQETNGKEAPWLWPATLLAAAAEGVLPRQHLAMLLPVFRFAF